MADFKKAFERTMGWEGFHSDDPADKGGDTYWGISHVHHPEVQPWPPNREQAEAFYKINYWDSIKLDLVASDRVAWKIFDIGVNMGIKTAARFAQYAVKVVVDGIVGAKTIGAINAGIETLILGSLRQQQITRYESIMARDPTQERFRKGWVRRADDIAEDWA